MEEENSSKKFYVIAGIIIVLVVIAGAVFYFLRSGNGGSGVGTTSFGALFGNTGSDTPRTQAGSITPGGNGEENNSETGAEAAQPLFKQLSNLQVAGAISIEKDGNTFVRYIARENGYVYDVDPVTGKSTQITNTTIPRIYEAYWANKGNTVIVRYLKHDDVYQKDVIKTFMANLALPVTPDGSAMGELKGNDSLLPDNIASISVSPNGTRLFYLLPVSDGISGTIVNISTKISTEVFRNSFTEWIPQLLNTGNIILTSKASANVPGYAYLYDVGKKTLSRLLREKNGLTTLATPTGGRILYSENQFKSTLLSFYDEKGFDMDEGAVTHVSPLQLATLPEKCAWSANAVRIYCGAFASTPNAQIPDDWYQGVLSFTDTFWTINTELSDLTLLADPLKETGRTIDVFMPFVDRNETHFYFIDKNDSTLWSMRLEKEKFSGTGEEPPLPTVDSLNLSPDELKDAIGSLPTTTAKTKK